MDKQIMPISASDSLFVLFLDLLIIYLLCARCLAVCLGSPSLHLFGFFLFKSGRVGGVTGIGGFKLHQLAT